MVAQINHVSNVLDISITDRPGIAVTYDRRFHAPTRKTALKRDSTTDYATYWSLLARM